MSTIVTRAGKGSPLTTAEADANFTNLNTDKYQAGNNASFGTLATSGAATIGGVLTYGGSLVGPTDASHMAVFGRYSAGYTWSLIRPDSVSSGLELRTFGGTPMLQLNQSTLAAVFGGAITSVGSGVSSFRQASGRNKFAGNANLFNIAVAYNDTRSLADQTPFIGATDSATPDLVISNAGGTELARFKTDNNFVVTGNIQTTGSITPSSLLDISGATAGQIKFPATQNASADANTLDDYEEGAWTPTVTSAGGSITSYTSSGQYVKVGKKVTLSFQITVTNNGTGSGLVQVTNMPFAVSTLDQAGAGREAGVSGSMVVLRGLNTTVTLNIYAYNNAYPASTGAVLQCNITYITTA